MTGLENANEEDGKKLALDLVQKWVKNNYVTYVQSKGKMFEKYDVEQVRNGSFLIILKSFGLESEESNVGV